MIEIHNVKGVIKSLSDKPLEPKDGQKMQLVTTLKVTLEGVPEHLDQFLDSTQAGTKPSAILWSGGRQGEGDKNRFVRWLGMLEAKFTLNQSLDFMLKLCTIPLKDEPAESIAKTRIELALPMRFKGKGVYLLLANGCNIDLPCTAEVTDEHFQQLRALRRHEKLDLSVYQRQADFVAPNNEPPRPESGKVVSIGKGRKGPEKGSKGGKKGSPPPASSAGAEDALFPSVVEHVVKTRKATIPDLQLAFKITDERATELMAALYELEVVGPADTDGNHEVRWTEKDIAESKNTGADAIPPGGAAAEIE